MRLGSTGPVLVSRTGELDRFDTLLTALLAGQGGLALVTGEAGVGKTRLVAEVIARATGRRASPSPWVTVADLGEGIWPLGAPARSSTNCARRSPPMPGRRSPSRHRRPTCANCWPPRCAAVARRQPLLVVVEDLHWSGLGTQLFVSLLARSNPSAPLLLIGTYRSDELHQHHPWRPVLAELMRSARPERFSLMPLDGAGTAEMLAAIGLADSTALAADVHRRSGGNPYFIEELVAAAADGVTGISESLRDVVLARTSQLDVDARRAAGHQLRSAARLRSTCSPCSAR